MRGCPRDAAGRHRRSARWRRPQAEPAARVVRRPRIDPHRPQCRQRGVAVGRRGTGRAPGPIPRWARTARQGHRGRRRSSGGRAGARRPADRRRRRAGHGRPLPRRLGRPVADIEGRGGGLARRRAVRVGARWWYITGISASGRSLSRLRWSKSGCRGSCRVWRNGATPPNCWPGSSDAARRPSSLPGNQLETNALPARSTATQ